MAWETKRLKDLFDYFQAGDNINADKIEIIDDYPVYGGNGIRGFCSKYNWEKKCLLIGRQGALCGNIHRVNKKIWATEHAVIAKPKKEYDLDFLYYLLQFMNLNQYAQSTAAQPGLSVNFIRTLFCLIPEKSQQKRIADFLDAKTQKIDARIELLEKKKERYTTLRKALINEAVDGEGKGWKTVRMKDIGVLYSGLSGKSGDDFQDEENPNNKPFIPFTNIFNNDIIDPTKLGYVVMNPDDNQNVVQKNDLFFLMSSEDYDGLGKNSLLTVNLEETYLNSFCKGFRIKSKEIFPEFLNYLLQSFNYRNRLKIEGKGFTRMNLKSEKIACFSITYPQIEKQKEIVQFLDTKTKIIDEIILNIERQIDSLKTYRRALINEAVTGKLYIE